MDFPITVNSQDEFDKLVSSRLEREAKKYEGFDAYKADSVKLAEFNAKDYPGQIQKLQDSLKAANDSLAKAQSESKAKADADAASIAELTGKLTAAELVNLKTEAALNAGLDYSLASRLNGTTAEELKADAEKLAPMFKSGVSAPPMGGNDPKPASKTPAFANAKDSEVYSAYGTLTAALLQR